MTSQLKIQTTSTKMKTNSFHSYVLVSLLVCIEITTTFSQASRFHENRKYRTKQHGLDRGRCETNKSSSSSSSSSLALFSDEVVDGLYCGTGKWGNDDLRRLRIIGGRDARAGEFPYSVLFFFRKFNGDENYAISKRKRNRDDESTETLCGGVIIDNYHILTAAHCLSKCEDPREQYLDYIGTFLGEHSTKQRGEGEKIVELNKFTIHPHYDICDHQNRNDIAMAETKKRMNFTLTMSGYGSVNRVCMRSYYQPEYPAGTKAIVTGWGLTNPNVKEVEDILQVAEVEIADMEYCERAWAGMGIDRNKQICAHQPNGNQAICYGDSGGLLAVKNSEGRYEVIGITSYTSPNCDYAYGPQVYTRVSAYLDWIEATKRRDP